jgi:transposase
MPKRSMFVGMDVHKESIDVSLADEGRDGEVRHYGVIPGDLEAVATVVRALRAPHRRLRFVYEAGPCGFGIHRYLTAQGEDCVVVNPSSMPKRSGDRIKTDRRDGDALARLHRAGELTAIYVPTPDDEALRDLVRAREDAVGLSTQAKHRLKAFLLRQGRRYPGRAGWTRPYRRWLADLSFPLAPQHIALQEYRDTIDETERRVERLTDQLRQQTPAWRWAPVVDALQALRGVSFVTAVGLIVEVGDIRRFDHPRQLMAFLGLVPSEYSSGPSVRRGGITKAGNPHARRLLAEAAWAYQGVPRIGRHMLYRQEALPKTVCDIAWKAQLRLTSRFRKLVARGKAKPKVATAIARELTGFIWAIAREVPAPPA